MMDAGWAEKEQEDTGAQICRELMEKLDIKSYETVRKVFPCAGPLLSEAVMMGEAFISF